MQPGLEYIAFCVQKHRTPLVTCSNPPLGSRQAARSYETDLLWHTLRNVLAGGWNIMYIDPSHSKKPTRMGTHCPLTTTHLVVPLPAVQGQQTLPERKHHEYYAGTGLPHWEISIEHQPPPVTDQINTVVLHYAYISQGCFTSIHVVALI